MRRSRHSRRKAPRGDLKPALFPCFPASRKDRAQTNEDKRVSEDLGFTGIGTSPARVIRSGRHAFSARLSRGQPVSCRHRFPISFIAARQEGQLKPGSAQLAVLVAASINAGEFRLLFAYGLTGDAGPRADQRHSASQRDRLAAFLAFFESNTRRHTRSRSRQSIPHAILDLILNRALRRPSTCHVPLSLCLFVAKTDNIGKWRRSFTGQKTLERPQKLRRFRIGRSFPLAVTPQLPGQAEPARELNGSPYPK